MDGMTVLGEAEDPIASINKNLQNSADCIHEIDGIDESLASPDSPASEVRNRHNNQR